MSSTSEETDMNIRAIVTVSFEGMTAGHSIFGTSLSELSFFRISTNGGHVSVLNDALQGAAGHLPYLCVSAQDL